MSENEQPNETTNSENEQVVATPVKKEVEIRKRPEAISELYHSYSFMNDSFNNIYYTSENTIVTAVGNVLHFLNLETLSYTKWLSPNHDGIGAITVHPSKQYIAIGDIGNSPDINIYSLPDMKLVRTLKNGTKRAYSALNFNQLGGQLASVGSNPDYTLTIWNWNEEKIVLRSKAFGQDVYNVTFSPSLEGQLTTSGLGHIKFWKMSSTFTGLKLKGAIGKFGKVDISDITGYLEFPDGKVLSGSEQGNLLLWENNLIKVLIKQEEDQPCHDGSIEFIARNEDGYIMTAGRDGQIKYWQFDAIDVLEPSDSSNLCLIKPVQSYAMPTENTNREKIEIVNMIENGNDSWIIQDATGAFWRVVSEKVKDSDPIEYNHSCELLIEFSAGSLYGVDTALNQHTALVSGQDGFIRLYDYVNSKLLQARKFSSAARIVRWNREGLDPSLTTFTSAHNDGTIRICRQTAAGIELLDVKKPHQDQILGFAYSPNNAFVASFSKDGTIWFLKTHFDDNQCLSHFSPIGFTKAPGTLLSMRFKTEKYIIFTTNEGTILRMPVPDMDSIDTSQTFEFSFDAYQTYNYKQYVKPPPKKKKKKKESEEGDEDEEDFGEEEEEEDEEDEFVEPPLKPVLTTLDSIDESHLLISFDDQMGFYRYAGMGFMNDNVEEPEYADLLISNCLFDPAPITDLKYSRGGRYLIAVTGKGKIRLFDSEDHGLYEDKLRYTVDLHNNRPGGTVFAQLSFDDKMLVSVSDDGCLFVQKLGEPESVSSINLKESIDESTVTDIIRDDHWSIEEDRIKSALQAKEEAALSRKDRRLLKLKNLREEYHKIVSQNNRLKKSIPRKDLQLDNNLEDDLKVELEEKLVEARKELEFDSVKTKMRLDRVYNEYLGCLDYERIVLKAFKTGRVVSTFRTRKLSEDLLQKVKEIQEMLEETTQAASPEQEEEGEGENELQEPKKIQRKPKKRREKKKTQKKSQKLSKTDSHKPISQVEKRERQRKQIEERKRRRAELESRKPTDEDDPELMNEIVHAEQNMGDYKLKTDENYILPENQRMTAEKKLRQIVLLEHSIHALKTQFNQELLKLRLFKGRYIEKFKKYNVDIQRINEELRCKEAVINPQFDDCEYPELREHISDHDIQVHIQRKEAEKRRQENADRGVFLQEQVVEPTKSDKETASVHSYQSKQGSHQTRSIRGKELSMRERLIQSLPVSHMERQEKEMNRHKLLYEKERLSQKINKYTDDFDKALDDLRSAKFKLEADLTNAELRLILTYKELELLKEFEILDNQHYDDLQKKREAKAETQNQLQQCAIQLKEKEQELKDIIQSEHLVQEFHNLVPQSHPAHAQLFSVYKKVKGKKNNNDDSDSDSDSDSEEESDEEEGEGPTIERKPDNVDCTEEVWDAVINLRNKRLAREQQLEAMQRSIETLNKTKKQLTKEDAQVSKELVQIETSIESVQLDKQNKLNDLQTVVVLKFNQLQDLVNNRIPEQMDKDVVFMVKGLHKLSLRIAVLKDEQRDLHSHYVQLQKRLAALYKEQKTKSSTLNEASNHVKEVQMLKFGQTVDLEALENASVDKKAEELKSSLTKQENESESILKQWDVKINGVKDRLATVTQQNTKLLTQMAELRTAQQTIEKDLNSGQDTMVKRLQKGMQVKDNRKQSLKELVVAQAREIELCKNEIAILRSKTTHVYSPALR